MKSGKYSLGYKTTLKTLRRWLSSFGFVNLQAQGILKAVAGYAHDFQHPRRKQQSRTSPRCFLSFSWESVYVDLGALWEAESLHNP